MDNNQTWAPRLLIGYKFSFYPGERKCQNVSERFTNYFWRWRFLLGCITSCKRHLYFSDIVKCISPIPEMYFWVQLFVGLSAATIVVAIGREMSRVESLWCCTSKIIFPLLHKILVQNKKYELHRSLQNLKPNPSTKFLNKLSNIFKIFVP